MDIATLTIPRPELKQVVEWMRKFSIKGKSDLEIRTLVERLCADLQQGDYASEVLACYYWVCGNTRYMRDIHDVEFLKEPRQALAAPALDCDDQATLLAAMLMACGNQCQFALVSFVDSPMPSHVFVQVKTPAGFITLDPVANRDTAKMLSRVTHGYAVPVEEAGPVGPGGPGGGGGPGTGRWIMSGDGTGPATAGTGQMVYSVYDYLARQYDYYQGPAATPSSGWFRKPTGDQNIPERLAARLPPSARKVGSGQQARGLIATREPGMGAIQGAGPGGTADGAGGTSWLTWAGIFLAGWWFGRRGRS